jgi:DNA-binding MltR family transcriptional regulator
MTSRPRRQSHIKKLAKQIPDAKKIGRILSRLEMEDSILADYAIAMIGAELLNGALEAALHGRFRKLDEKTEVPELFSYEQNGPLADLGSRIKVAYAMNLFGPETRDDLNSIRRIRNLFAHHPEQHSFWEPEIAEECRHLHIVNTLTIAHGVDRRDPRSRYIGACTTIAGRLRDELLGGLRHVHVLP